MFEMEFHYRCPGIMGTMERQASVLVTLLCSRLYLWVTPAPSMLFLLSKGSSCFVEFKFRQLLLGFAFLDIGQSNLQLRYSDL
jgi:hypothetical protein